MDSVLEALIGVAIACTFLASARIAVVGVGNLPETRWFAFIAHDRWAVCLVLLLPSLLGEFARGEVSALPWAAFSHAAARHGVLDGLWTAISVISVELWLLWIPAHSYVLKRPELDRRTVALARSLNLAVGLLLLTPENPIYRLIDVLPVGSHVEE
jgi:hypothetical protein